MKLKKFWNWAKNEETGSRELFFDGIIAQESWWDDDITPEAFRKELYADEGDVVIWLNSPGGDCIAASRIYTMLTEYKGSKGDITVKIDGLAASAASVIAMAGTETLMSPTAMMMIHNPWTFAWGDSDEMKKAIAMLDEFKESIMNAYHIKTGLSRAKISHLMNDETWMNALKAVEFGFADGLTVEKRDTEQEADSSDEDALSFAFSRQTATSALLNKVKAKGNVSGKAQEKQKHTETPPQDSVKQEKTQPTEAAPQGVTIKQLMERLDLISH